MRDVCVPKTSFTSYTWCAAFNCCRSRVKFGSPTHKSSLEAPTFSFVQVPSVWRYGHEMDTYITIMRTFANYTGSPGFSGDGCTCTNSGLPGHCFLTSSLGMRLHACITRARLTAYEVGVEKYCNSLKYTHPHLCELLKFIVHVFEYMYIQYLWGQTN